MGRDIQGRSEGGAKEAEAVKYEAEAACVRLYLDIQQSLSRPGQRGGEKRGRKRRKGAKEGKRNEAS
jgi:hypothetical protein